MIFDLQLFANLTTGIGYDTSTNVMTFKDGLGKLGDNPSVNTSVALYFNNGSLSFKADAAVINGVALGTADANTSVFSTTALSIKSGPSYKINLDTTSISFVDLGTSQGVNILLSSVSSNFGLKVDDNSTKNTFIFNGDSDVNIKGGNSTIGKIKDLTLSTADSLHSAILLNGTQLGGVTVAGKKSGLTFTAVSGVLNFGDGSKGVNVAFGEGGATGAVSASLGKGTYNFTSVSGGLAVTSLNSAAATITGAAKGFTLNMASAAGADSTSSVLINSSASNDFLNLTGKGIETLAVSSDALTGNHTSVSGWVFASGEDSVAANVVKVNTAVDVDSIAGSFGDKLTITYGSGMSVQFNSAGGGVTETSKQALGVRFNVGSSTKDILFTSGSAMTAADASYDISKFDVLVANSNTGRGILDMGDRGDQSVVWLAGDGKTEKYGVTQKLVGYGSVVSGKGTSSLLISDLEDVDTLILGQGEADSIFTGVGGTAKGSAGDTIGSAKGKYAYLGTSNYSGVDYIKNQSDAILGVTTSFDYATGTDSLVGDVITLMHGAGHMEVTKAGFEVGADDNNYLVLENIGDGSNDILYSNEIGGATQLARVDGSKKGAELKYSDAVNFYVGNGSTTITLGSDAEGDYLNYNGGAVMMGVSDIDASKAGANNVIYGKSGEKQTITASASGATSICGGLAGEGDYSDTADDVLVGGKNTTFYVGENMGSDHLTNIQTGDTIVFLGTKYEGNSGIVNDNIGTSISFTNKNSIRLDSATNMAAVTDLTAEFEDCTWKWDGANWTYTAK